MNIKFLLANALTMKSQKNLAFLSFIRKFAPDF